MNAAKLVRCVPEPREPGRVSQVLARKQDSKGPAIFKNYLYNIRKNSEQTTKENFASKNL